MITFGRLWHILENQAETDSEGKSMQAIRSGQNLRKDDCGDFWDDFISVCGNADAMADLLEVPREKVTGWASKIRTLIDKIDAADSNEADADEKAELMPTGDLALANQDGTISRGQEMNPVPS